LPCLVQVLLFSDCCHDENSVTNSKLVKPLHWDISTVHLKWIKTESFSKREVLGHWKYFNPTSLTSLITGLVPSRANGRLCCNSVLIHFKCTVLISQCSGFTSLLFVTLFSSWQQSEEIVPLSTFRFAEGWKVSSNVSLPISPRIPVSEKDKFIPFP
jgi:hypothetical protein